MSYLCDILILYYMDEHKEKFGQIYDQYIDKIYRFIYLKVSSQETAEDITSKVFLKGWESYFAQGGNVSNIAGFLYKIARNAVIDHYRDKGRTNVVSVDHLAELADHKSNIHERAVINEEVEKVKLALQNIKKDYQDMIIMHYLEDMPIQEISEVMERPPGTVRVMLHRGIKALKTELS